MVPAMFQDLLSNHIYYGGITSNTPCRWALTLLEAGHRLASGLCIVCEKSSKLLFELAAAAVSARSIHACEAGERCHPSSVAAKIHLAPFGIVRGLRERVKLAEEGINEFGDPLVPGVFIGPVKSNQECADRYGIDAFPC